MCANGSRSSTHCGKPDNEPIRYSATNPTSTPHATGLKRGASPNNATATAAGSQTAGSCTSAVPSTIDRLPPTSGAAVPEVGPAFVPAAPDRAGGADQRDHEMTCQPTASADRATQQRLGPLR